MVLLIICMPYPPTHRLTLAHWTLRGENSTRQILIPGALGLSVPIRLWDIHLLCGENEIQGVPQRQVRP